MSRRVLLSEVREVFTTNTQVPSTLGAQLERLSNAELPNTFHDRMVQRSNLRVAPVWQPESMHVNRIPIVEVHLDEQGILDRAAVFRCAADLEHQAEARWCKLRTIPRFSTERNLLVGSVVAAVLRAAGSSASLLARNDAVARFLRRHGGRELLAPETLLEAEYALETWVDAWNRQKGFRPWMSSKEFALRYAVPEALVVHWCARGRLPAQQTAGKHWRIDMTNIPEPREV